MGDLRSFFDSSTVYQGAARNLDLKPVTSLNAFAVGDCVPDLTFVLDIDRGTAHSRLGNRTKIRDRLEEESDAFREQVIQAYDDLAKNEPERIVLIDGRLSADVIGQRVWHQLTNRFPVLTSNQPSTISQHRS